MKNENKKGIQKAAKNTYKWLIESIEWYYTRKTDAGRRTAIYEIEWHLQTLNRLRNALAAK